MDDPRMTRFTVLSAGIVLGTLVCLAVGVLLERYAG